MVKILDIFRITLYSWEWTSCTKYIEYFNHLSYKKLFSFCRYSGSSLWWEVGQMICKFHSHSQRWYDNSQVTHYWRWPNGRSNDLKKLHLAIPYFVNYNVLNPEEFVDKFSISMFNFALLKFFLSPRSSRLALTFFFSLSPFGESRAMRYNKVLNGT